ncbi:Sad1-interacting factor 3 [Golovinomyces cichoracearum]|uniref:Sad1-interacting factor 3 n=1 Tax=Golovinomyces cichoracearum TaxID=62708 RepID=A0A420ICL6_9PEZI|nr:Sad1-interacting factor 3 [Golovinomyces cichoracearum]
MVKSSVGKKKGPSVLVTDSRERSLTLGKSLNYPRAGAGSPGKAHQSTSTRLISVDNLLCSTSEIPSGQSRNLPNWRRETKRRGSGLLSLGLLPQNVPGRSTKVTEKLVLLPETIQVNDHIDEELPYGHESDEDDRTRPLNDTEKDFLNARGGIRGKSYAERLPKDKRADKLARVTAYCTAQGYKTKATAAFVKKSHGARTKLYDDCLYIAYHLPLLPGTEGIRIRSSPILKSPGGKAVLDEEIERSEQRDYHEGFFEERDKYRVRDGEGISPGKKEDDRKWMEEERRSREKLLMMNQALGPNSSDDLSAAAKFLAEMFVFSYGVMVFWNFTEKQEKDILADLTFSNNNNANSLVTRPLEEGDFEKEEFHFEYSSNVEGSRVFNDMITLRSGDHMIKLTMSYAIAQSTKLSLFEEQMCRTMLDAQHIPKYLALTGQLGLSRSQILKILGNLFKSRVDVNLSSNILDVPNFFWDSEPTLHPLYFAILEYLEIAPRIKALNRRCKVFLELAEILSDSIADTKMSRITWIIIFLIIISICVTILEVGLRSMLYDRRKFRVEQIKYEKDWTEPQFTSQQLEKICGTSIVGKTFAET